MRHVDLFAGTGAFSYALQKQGVETVFANDMLPSSKAIYDANFEEKLTLQDLCEIDVKSIPPHDILTGGFPCQPFSIAGKREGFQDTRSNVFWKILEIIDFHTPQCVILENVKNLVSHDNKRTFATIRSELEKRDYSVCFKVLNTSQITNVPQHRERIYIIALADKSVAEKFTLEFPSVDKREIRELLDDNVDAKYYYTNKVKAWSLIDDNVKEQNKIYQFRRVYVRENKNNECPTLTANMGSGGHNVPLVMDEKGKRKLTPRECFRFQGFPDSYILPRLADNKLYSLAGNAVSLPVVELIASRLVPFLKMSSNEP